MQVNESYELVSKKSLRFPKNYDRNSEEPDDSFGGVIKRGQIGWRANGQYFEVFSMKTGHKITQFSFDTTLGLEDCIITCICEIQVQSGCLLAIGVQYGDSSGGLIAIFSLKNCQILRCIEVQEKVISCHYIPPEIVKRTVLNLMSGCIAIGTDSGSILLCDLNLASCEEFVLELSSSDNVQLCRSHVYEGGLDIDEIEAQMHHAQEEDLNFVIKLEAVDGGCFVLCLQSVIPLLSLFVGLEDGRLVMYDLTSLRLLDVIEPVIKMSPLVRLSYLEPPDDPQPCIYIWAFHENPQNSVAVMHSLMFQRRVYEEDGVTTYKHFESFNTVLTLPLNSPGSIPITCQAVTKIAPNGEEEAISLCMLAWKKNERVEIFIFDINQWYKEQMPPEGDWREGLSYLATFHLNYANPLDIYLDVNSLAWFNTIQRCEEHFYPNALSFDCLLLQSNGSYVVTWAGLQNNAISALSAKGSLAILQPNELFSYILEASLLPQFCEHNKRATFSLKARREVLLSVALEYNCVGLLKDCAKSWSDGSYEGQDIVDSLTLSTLTNWAWNRAENIKHQCNIICRPLFDLSGYGLDERSTRELIYLSRQLRLLSDILDFILVQCNRHIPHNVQDIIRNQQKSIKMASEYQEVLLWFVNIGLLPEQRENITLIPYGFLRNYYMCQRESFSKVNASFINPRTNSCKILFIDSFMDHELNARTLRDQWIESGGDGLYPPPSLQAMLRLFLVPDVSFEKKCSLLMYFFLDLNSSVENEAYAGIVQSLIKFPAVFNLSACVIKTIQAFWNLDHGQFKAAVDEVISPFFGTSNLPQYQLELMIEALLGQSETKLALRTLQIRKIQISSLLELKVFLANDMIAEAFHYARSKSDIDLMKIFIKACICFNKFQILRDLALTDEEGEIVINILKERKNAVSSNVKITYFIHKGKYIEALDHLQEMSTQNDYSESDIERTSIILSLYNKGISPVCREINDSYYQIKNGFTDKEQNIENPYPLSSQLKKGNLSKQKGGIYRSSALGIHYASYYWEKQHEKNPLNYPVNAPFVRQTNFSEIFGNTFRTNSICYPEPFISVSKRRYDEDFDLGRSRNKDELENPQKKRKLRQEEVGSNFYTSFSMSAINTSLLTKFKTKSSLHNSVLQRNASFTQQKEQEIAEKQNVFNLDTPIIRTVEEMESESSSVSGSPLHGILKSNEKNVSSNSLRADQEDEEKALRFDLPDMSMNASVAQKDLNLSVMSSSMNESVAENTVQKDLNLSVMSAMTADSTIFFSPYSSRENTVCIEEQESELYINSSLKRPDSLNDKVKGRPPIRSSAESLVTMEDDNERDEELIHPSMADVSEANNTFDEANLTMGNENPPLKDEQQDIGLSDEVEGVMEEQVVESPGIDSVEQESTNIAVIEENVKEEQTIPKEAVVSPDFKEPHQSSAPTSINKINTKTFAPFVSSSKFCEQDKPDTLKPLCEKSTVVGGSMFFQESFSTTTTTIEKSSLAYYTALESQPNLDSTVGMSGFDCTLLGIPREDAEDLEEEHLVYEVDCKEDSDVVCVDSSSGSVINQVFGDPDEDDEEIESLVQSINDSSDPNDQDMEERDYSDYTGEVSATTLQSMVNVYSCNVESSEEASREVSSVGSSDVVFEEPDNANQLDRRILSSQESSQETKTVSGTSEIEVEDPSGKTFLTQQMAESNLDDETAEISSKPVYEMVSGDNENESVKVETIAEQFIRAASTSKETVGSPLAKRLLRGSSVPKASKSNPPHIEVTTRIRSRRRSQLDKIEEDSPLPSPSANWRKRIDSQDSDAGNLSTPGGTPTRMTRRRSSNLDDSVNRSSGSMRGKSEDVDVALTPRRSKRRSLARDSSEEPTSSTPSKSNRRKSVDVDLTPRRLTRRSVARDSPEKDDKSTPGLKVATDLQGRATPVKNSRSSVARDTPEVDHRATPVRNLRSNSSARDTPERESISTPVRNLRRSVARDTPEKEIVSKSLKSLRRTSIDNATPEQASIQRKISESPSKIRKIESQENVLLPPDKPATSARSSTRTKSSEASPKKDEIKLSSRRMTRTQKAKAAEIEEKIKGAQKEAGKNLKVVMNADVGEGDMSDTDSSSSRISQRSHSSRTSTRKPKRKPSNEDDAVSVASSRSGVSLRKRKTAAVVSGSPDKMHVIPEEANSDNDSVQSSSTVGSTKRTRTLRSKK